MEVLISEKPSAIYFIQRQYFNSRILVAGKWALGMETVPLNKINYFSGVVVLSKSFSDHLLLSFIDLFSTPANSLSWKHPGYVEGVREHLYSYLYS